MSHVRSDAERIDQDADQPWHFGEFNGRGGDAPPIPPVAEHHLALPGLPRDPQRRSPSANVGDIQAYWAHITIMDPLRRCVEVSRRARSASSAEPPGVAGPLDVSVGREWCPQEAAVEVGHVAERPAYSSPNATNRVRLGPRFRT